MTTKKTRSAAATPSMSGKQIIGFIGDVKGELKKISWTTKEELKAYTKVVVIATFIFGLAIYGVDLFIRGFLDGISVIFKVLGG